jgi:hypothetical protein
LTIRKLRVVAEANLLLKGLGSWTKLQRVGENLRANVASQIGCFVNNTSQHFDHNSLISRPFLARKVSNRSSHHAPRIGQGVVSSIQLLVQSSVRSNLVNLSQTWSNSVKALRTLGNVSWVTFRGFLGIVGPSWVRNGSVKPWSNLGQPWSN